jgi:hypothetical protein
MLNTALSKPIPSASLESKSSTIKEFAETAAEAKAEKQYGPAMTGLTAIAKLAGLWVDRAENINGNYAISDKPLTEQEWVEKHVKH